LAALVKLGAAEGDPLHFFRQRVLAVHAADVKGEVGQCLLAAQVHQVLNAHVPVQHKAH